jgi:dipeptidyl aminopeptidase/acylaminoacyl peptidase
MRFIILILLVFKSNICLSIDNIKNMNLIPRKILFGNPENTSPQITPDGTFICFLKNIDGVMNIFLQTIKDNFKAEQLSKELTRSITSYFIAYDNKHILYLKDKDGDENFSLYSINIASKEIKHLTPFNDTRIFIYKVNYKFPEKIIVGINNRDKKWHDPYELNILTGELKLIFKNNEYTSFVFDNDYNLRYGYKKQPDGKTQIYSFDSSYNSKLFTEVDFEDKAFIIGFNEDSSKIYWLDNRDSDKTALIIEEIKTQEKKLIAINDKSDISDILIEPKTKKIQGYLAEYLEPEIFFLDQSIKNHFTLLKSIDSGHINLLDRSLDDTKWIVSYNSDICPTKFYLYDTKKREAQYLFTTKPELSKYKLQHMKPLVIKARDGVELVSYLTLPAYGNKPYPLVVNVHGGPRVRDSWGLNILHQWLANRGYAVLSVNYRGSDGLGKEFVNAGNLEWGRKMHYDLIDAATYLIQEGIVDPKKIAIEGGSYGGYAALVGLTFTPDFFCCGVDIVGPSSLVTLINSIPEYWKPMVSLFHKMIGDPNTKDGLELLEERSPINKIDNIKKPLLIQHGIHDPRVKVAESRQIVDLMRKKNIPVIYMEFETEGHGFLMPQNKIAAYVINEIFLSKYLGGKVEDINETEYTGAKFSIPFGKEYLEEIK